ncbi:MAG: hypothetical protein KA368_05590 [Acidobacteria bacterium]|nr:hypothetical protein [Acidobacteriota bacterium]
MPETLPVTLKALLDYLSAHCEDAGERYEALRRSVMRYLEQRAVFASDELADEILDRVARRIEMGEEVREIGGYCLGVARNVYLEWQRNPRNNHLPIEELDRYPVPEAQTDEAWDSSQLICMQKCLQSVADGKQELLREYFRGQGGERTKRREVIAGQLGINQAALYNRVSRLVERLRQCKDNCLRQSGLR